MSVYGITYLIDFKLVQQILFQSMELHVLLILILQCKSLFSLHSGMGTLYKQPRNSLAVGCNFKSVADRAVSDFLWILHFLLSVILFPLLIIQIFMFL